MRRAASAHVARAAGRAFGRPAALAPGGTPCSSQTCAGIEHVDASSSGILAAIPEAYSGSGPSAGAITFGIAAAVAGVALVPQVAECRAEAANGGSEPAGATAGEEELDEDGESKMKMSYTARWRLCTDMGRELYEKNDWAQAEVFFKKALKHAEKGFGKGDEHVAAASNNLAELYRVQGRFKEAEKLYLEGLAIMEKFLGPVLSFEHASIGQGCHNLGGLYLQMGRYKDAKRFFQKALDVYAEGIGDGHPHYARTLHQLAEAHRLLGDAEGAYSLLAQSLQKLEDCGAGRTVATVRLRARLARLAVQRRDWGRAEGLQRALLGYAQEIAKGPSAAINVATARESLAQTLYQAGGTANIAEARDLLEDAMDVRASQAGGGLDGPAAGATRRMMAEAEMAAGDAAAAAGHLSAARANADAAWARARAAAAGWEGVPPPVPARAIELSRVCRAESSHAALAGEGADPVAPLDFAKTALAEAEAFATRMANAGAPGAGTARAALLFERAEVADALAVAKEGRAGAGWWARRGAGGQRRQAEKLRREAVAAETKGKVQGTIWLD